MSADVVDFPAKRPTVISGAGHPYYITDNRFVLVLDDQQLAGGPIIGKPTLIAVNGKIQATDGK